MLLVSCATSPKSKVQDKPPGFIGRLFDNTISRYNAFYNSNLAYENSMRSAKDGYQENYEELFAPSVQDVVARKGASGEMDAIIEKTTAIIEKKPYSKWVDDEFLLNGIAHYVKGDYEMAERIFRYVSSEYKAGVIAERVTSRQKVKGAERAKQAKKEAEKKLKEAEQRREEKLKEYEEAKREREERARESAKDRARRAKNLKKRNKRLKKAAENEAAERRKAGLDVDAKEIVKDIKAKDREITKAKSKISEKDKERLAKAPVAEIDVANQKEGLLAHELASKDALLWLAKTYITTEQFIAANAVLTVINEDEYFPSRLNADYYLTYADMHIRLDNKPKAIEYVQLAAESARRNERGRLYYLIGQLYADLGQWQQAEEAFNTVEKYHPHYDMIYHAKIKNIERALTDGRFKTVDFVTPLKRMTKDAKNDEFLDEVYYYLGEAYAAQDSPIEAVDAYNKSIENGGDSGNKHVSKKTYLALGHQYYNYKEFKKAEPNFQEALGFMEEGSPEFQTTSLYAKNLKIVNESIEQIHLQDSLLALSAMPDEELERFIEKKVNKEIRQEFKEKLQEENESFGNASQSASNRRRNRNEVPEGFYFYDLQQSAIGYTEFKQKWGNRPNVDNWRSSSAVARDKRNNITNREDYEEVEISSKEQRIIQYLSEIPKTDAQKKAANKEIYSAYGNLINSFLNVFGDDELATYYYQELKKRNPPADELKALSLVEQSQADTETTLTKNSTVSEIEALYNQTYSAYEAGKFEKALQLIERSKSFTNNQFQDKFAFIEAMSIGQQEGEKRLTKELKDFIQRFPNSPLRAQAVQLINQK